MKVLSVASEFYPLVKTGGLADVAGALPGAMRPHGVEVVTLLPAYPAAKRALPDAKSVWTNDDLFGGPASVLAGRTAGLDLMLLDAPHLFDRPGNPYLGPDGRDWPDNAFRFAALGWIAARIGLGDVASFVPDIVHGHDWQSGLAFAYLAFADRPRPATVITIHNLAFQGLFPTHLREALRLPPQAFAAEGAEYYGQIGFLKAGLHFADHLTTVSPTYAREIQTPAGGCGLDGLLHARASVLSGILNGIDTGVWNPATDPSIAARFDVHSLAARRPNKRALQARFGLEQDENRLLFGLVSRLSMQKGIDLLADAMPALIAAGAQLAVLGSGDADLERRLVSAATVHPGRIGCIIGYDEDLAHRVQAGSDALLVPSRFEPCGLTQFCALRYGAVPVVARVGGLADSIIGLDPANATDGRATGLQFAPVTQSAIEEALRRTAALWADQPRWQRVQRNGMTTDVSWTAAATRYAGLYADLRPVRA
jgi:starch synthase